MSWARVRRRRGGGGGAAAASPFFPPPARGSGGEYNKAGDRGAPGPGGGVLTQRVRGPPPPWEQMPPISCPGTPLPAPRGGEGGGGIPLATARGPSARGDRPRSARGRLSSSELQRAHYGASRSGPPRFHLNSESPIRRSTKLVTWKELLLLRLHEVACG
ncbi:cuticle collagen 2-like [Varanus komodoensis]|uniref:cuticle collagen 2-like n=1 Tax=Varanus komodoensis TaxID=61221 RepID=UPI001CF77717|nr:cuticle collagen 2-like [Varanus komodoensis]